MEQPFEEQRYACFHLMASIALHPWVCISFFACSHSFSITLFACSVVRSPSQGIALINDEGGLLEFLLNRSTDNTKLGVDWKYKINQNIVNNEAFSELSTKFQKEFATYVRAGAFFHKYAPSVKDPLSNAFSS
jgi:hypothetical protein